MAWLQLGNTILLFISMHIPHSSSLSMSTSEDCLCSSSSLLRYLSMHTAFCFLSSASVTPFSSCNKDGYMTADQYRISVYQSTETTMQTKIHYIIIFKKTEEKRKGRYTIEFPNTCFSFMCRHGSCSIHIHLQHEKKLSPSPLFG
jgi:hypothetical protein